MFLRHTKRKKNGKEHRYFSVVENRRLADGRTQQRQVVYLGEINDSQEAAWRRSLEVFDEDRGGYNPLPTMATHSTIEWTTRTWNPVVGCSIVSPGCARCYAERMSMRLARAARGEESPGRKAHYLRVMNDRGRWNGHMETVEEALGDPLHWRQPSTIFSLEPLLGPLGPLDLRGIDWAVVGGESGPGCRPMAAEWARDIRRQCLLSGVRFFFKQWGHRRNNPDPADPTAKENGGPAKGGRRLDGVTWDQMPDWGRPAELTAVGAGA